MSSIKPAHEGGQMRRLWAGLILLMLSGASAVRAQQIMYFNVKGSVVALRPGSGASVDLFVTTPYYGSPQTYGGLSAYSIALLLDDAQVHIPSATAVPGFVMGDPTLTPGTGQV